MRMHFNLCVCVAITSSDVSDTRTEISHLARFFQSIDRRACGGPLGALVIARHKSRMLTTAVRARARELMQRVCRPTRRRLIDAQRGQTAIRVTRRTPVSLVRACDHTQTGAPASCTKRIAETCGGRAVCADASQKASDMSLQADKRT